MTTWRASFTLRGRSIERGLYAVRMQNGIRKSSGSEPGSVTMSPSSETRSGPAPVGSS